MAKIDNSILRTILNSYRALPIDADNTSAFTQDIYERIDKHRIKVVGLSDEEDATIDPYNPVTHESYCHTFYRMLGLPVISSTLGEFYNPGYYAPNLTDYANIRNQVDKNQPSNIAAIERAREINSATNMSKFLSKNDTALQYKINMLKNPRSVIVMQESTDPFAVDKQIEQIQGRASEFATVQHILRPFKCNSFLSPVDKILVPKKNLAAPFYKPVTNQSIESYSKTYLETVCKIRFSTTSSKAAESSAIQTLTDALKSVQIDGTSIFQNVIDNQSIIETYILNVLMNNFVNACLEYAGKTKEYKTLASRYDSLSDETVLLAEEIAQLEQQKTWYESIQAFIPNEVSNLNGTDVETNNPDDGVLAAPLISLINSPVRKIDQLLKDKNDKKSKHMSEINNISTDMFYMTGEVYGISVLEIMSLMIAFWSISQESLLSMLDAPAFNRLYDNNVFLRNSVVLDRYRTSDKAPPKDIKEVISEFDTTVYNLLSLADSIIGYSYKESQT